MIKYIFHINHSVALVNPELTWQVRRPLKFQALLLPKQSQSSVQALASVILWMSMPILFSAFHSFSPYLLTHPPSCCRPISPHYLFQSKSFHLTLEAEAFVADGSGGFCPELIRGTGLLTLQMVGLLPLS